MPTKDKDKKRQYDLLTQQRKQDLGFSRKCFWVHTKWDGDLDNIGHYIYSKDKKYKPIQKKKDE